MFLVHRPNGGPEKKYEFRPAKVDSGRASIAEKLYSKACGERRTWEQFVADATQGSITARKVALWLAITKDHPFAKYEDVVPTVMEVGELGMEYSRHELRLMRKGIEESTAILEVEKLSMLSGLDQQIAEAPVGTDEPDPEPEIEEPTEPGKDDPSDEPSSS